MNERIEKLVEQAIIQNEPDWIDFRKALTESGSLYLNVFAEKFAELIVAECAEVAHCNFHVDGLTLGGIMKKHFGVEE